MQTAANQCNRGGKQTFFTAASPKSENPTVFTVEDSRIVPVIQRFEILPKPPLPFGTEQRDGNATPVSIGFEKGFAWVHLCSQILAKTFIFNLLEPIRSNSRFYHYLYQ